MKLHQDRTNMLLGESCEGRFEIAIGRGIRNNELQPQRARPRLQVCDVGLDFRLRRVRENAEPGSIGHHLAEQLQFFRPQLVSEDEAAGNVPAWPVEAGDKTQCNRVNAGGKDDRNGRGRCLRRQRCGCAGGYDYRDAAADEIGRKRRQPIVLILCIPKLDRHVLAPDIAGFLQAPEKRNGVDLTIGELSAEVPSANRCGSTTSVAA